MTPDPGAPDAGSLDRSLVRGLAWTGGVKWATQFVTWAVTLVVARLLAPADYGVFGMAMVYLGLAQLLSEAGLLPVVVQARELDSDLAARLGGLAMLVGIAVCGLSAALSPGVAWFFHEPHVAPVVAALSTTFVLRGAQVLPRGLMLRALDFRRLAWVDATESLTAALVTVLCAVAGYRYWSLVAGALGGLAVSTALAWAWQPHRIALPRRIAQLGGSLRMGGHVVASQFAWYLYSNADFAVVGRMIGGAALGAYTLAWTIANVPVDRITGLVGRVTAPIFAAVQGDRAAMRRYVYTLTEGIALVTLPVCVGLALVADLLVRTMLVQAWEGAVAPLRILSLYAAFRCVTALLSQVLIFTGNARRNMEFSVLAAVLLPICFALATPWGTTGVALVWLTVYPVVIGGFYIHTTLAVTRLPLRSYAQALSPAFGATAVMTACVLATRWAMPATASNALVLAASVVAGAAGYVSVVGLAHAHRLKALLAIFRGRHERVSGATHVVSGDDEPLPEARLLLISWHFPPDPAVGARRWGQLARHAAERGWGIDVLMRGTTSLENRDTALLDALPSGTRVFEVPLHPPPVDRVTEFVSRALRRFTGAARATRGPASPTAGSASRAEIGKSWNVRDLARAWHAWVDHRRGKRWSLDAARVGRRLAERGVHRAIVSCGPPHWAHVAARRLSRDTGIPFIADLRDPWSMVERLPECIASPVTYALANRDERRVVRDAALVAMNTPRAADAMCRRHPTAATRIVAAPNGFDGMEAVPPASGDRFVVAYAGTIYLDRDPRPLLTAAALVVAQRHCSPDDFTLEFMGDVREFNGASLEAMAEEAGVAPFVRVRAPGTPAEAGRFLETASMLAVLPQDSDLAIPAKLFDYMQYSAWLLVQAVPGSATAEMLGGLDVDLVPPSNAGAIARAILKRYDARRAGIRPGSLANHFPLSRAARAWALFNAIEAITGPPPVGSRRAQAAPPPERIGDSAIRRLSSVPSVARPRSTAREPLRRAR